MTIKDWTPFVTRLKDSWSLAEPHPSAPSYPYRRPLPPPSTRKWFLEYPKGDLERSADEVSPLPRHRWDCYVVRRGPRLVPLSTGRTRTNRLVPVSIRRPRTVHDRCESEDPHPAPDVLTAHTLRRTHPYTRVRSGRVRLGTKGVGTLFFPLPWETEDPSSSSLPSA